MRCMLLEQSNVGEFPRPLEASDEFYRAIFPTYMKKDGGISYAAFSNTTDTDRMSVDWADKSTPQQTFDRWAKWGPCRGVVSITAELARNNVQHIEYRPKKTNHAHSDVVGGKSKQVRKALARGAKLVIPTLTSTPTNENLPPT